LAQNGILTHSFKKNNNLILKKCYSCFFCIKEAFICPRMGEKQPLGTKDVFLLCTREDCEKI
jgi:hypothetical protein